MVSARKDHNRRDSTNLHSYRQVVLLYRLVVQGVVHFDVRPREAVVRPLLQVESVMFVCLRGGSGHQTVENSRVVFYTGTNGGKKQLKSRVGLDRGAPMLETLSRDHDQKAKFQKKKQKRKIGRTKIRQPHAERDLDYFQKCRSGPNYPGLPDFPDQLRALFTPRLRSGLITDIRN
jgi:hypothetical protein